MPRHPGSRRSGKRLRADRPRASGPRPDRPAAAAPEAAPNAPTRPFSAERPRDWLPARAERAFSWFPGHMLRAQQSLAPEIAQADLVLELRDARLPLRSANPALAQLAGTRPRLVVLNKASLADPLASAAWHRALAARHVPHLFVDADSRRGLSLLLAEISALARPAHERLRARAIRPPPPRVVIVGLPNVGKSTLINRLAKRQRAKTAPMPGVTRHLTWIAVGEAFVLLDSPGIMLPRIASERDALALTWIGAIKDTILGPHRVAEALLTYLLDHPVPLPPHTWWPADWRRRSAPDLLAHAAAQRGFLTSGRGLDLAKAAQFLLEQYRMGQLGRLTFDEPPPE